jgi:outer membrane lipoprotein-sorting protein
MVFAQRVAICASLTAGVALAAPLTAPLAQAPAPAKNDVLARSKALYASLKSYADTGTVVHEYAITGVSRHAFKTYYRAPRHFYFDFTEDKADGAGRLAIWCEGGDFQMWWSDTGLHTAYPKGQGATAFTMAATFTGGAVSQMATLLFPTGGLVSTLTELTDMTDAGTEVIGGQPAHKLTGIARSTYTTGHTTNIRRTTIWIDAKTLLVRQIFEDTPKGVAAGSRLRITTTFEPQANPTLEDSRFKFVVPVRTFGSGGPHLDSRGWTSEREGVRASR